MPSLGQCICCSKEVSSQAKTCPHCGQTDPFFPNQTEMNTLEGRYYSSDEIRAEYSAVAASHTALLSVRFTIAGLYVAAMAFAASAVFGKESTWIIRAAGSGFAFWLGFSLWIHELRSRALQTNVGLRGVEIEHQHWRLIGEKWNSGFFSRQYRVRHPFTGEYYGPGEDVPPPASPPPSKLPPDNPTQPTVAWSRWPLPAFIDRYVTYGMGFDLLYAGSAIFWLVIMVISLVRIWQGEFDLLHL